MAGDDYFEVLQHEFNAEEGSFLLQLRCDLIWDKAAFTRLTSAMLACCQAYDEGMTQPTFFGPAYDMARIPRWLAEGFWYLSNFVYDWTTHPAWNERRAREPEYYRAAYERLHALGDWFFSGKCPYIDQAKGFEPM